MLLLTLLLLVVAAVLLVLSVATTTTAWAWASVAASALAAAVLAVRWWRLRRAVGSAGALPQAAPAPVEPGVALPPGPAPAVPEPRDVPEEAPLRVPPAPRDDPDPLPGAAGDGGPVAEPVGRPPAGPADGAGPARDVEVVVVDERPEYHRADCPRADPQLAEPLPRGEARALGFTPCPVCDPDDDEADRAGGPRRQRSSSG